MSATPTRPDAPQTARDVDIEAEEAWWRAHHASRPYVLPEFDADDYGPAYRLGIGQFAAGGTMDDDDALALAWQATKAKSRLWWEDARVAARDAFDRLAKGVAKGAPP